MAQGKGPAMRRLAVRVVERAGVRVEADYRSEGRSTKWYLTWANGPTVDVMRGHVRAAGRSVAGVDVAGVGYDRNYSDRYLVAAWLRRADRDGRIDGSRWSADRDFQSTSFPSDLADDDPLWEVVDYAFDRCGGPSSYADRVIDHVAGLGLRGLRIEHWLDQPDGLDPDSARRRVAPLLAVSGISERTQQSLHGVIDSIMRDLAGNGPRSNDPRVLLLVAEVARSALLQPVDDLQRRHALHCVASGTPLSTASVQLGKSPSTLIKRWNPAEFNDDLAPIAWLRQHSEPWVQACTDAAAETRTNRDLATDREVRALVSSLELSVHAGGSSWQQLLGSPDIARKLLAAVHESFAQLRRDRLRYQLNGDHADELALGPALQRLADLLTQYDAAPPVRRRGGSRRVPRHHD